jgi:GNAT superfamily N-acetyltransferase
VSYRKAAIRPLGPEDEALLFGLASLDRGADARTLTVLERETVFVAEVDQLFVSPEHEAEGVGRQLIEFAEGYAIAEGAPTLQVVVAGGDSRAVAFYRSRGFVAAGKDLLELVLPRR